MIVSHRHRFVFLKPRKVAGTSVEVALREHCGPEDIITPIGDYNAQWDQNEYENIGQNRTGYRRHDALEQARACVGEEIWRSYFTFSVVRNPWDLVVSQYHWATRSTALDRSFGHILSRLVRRPKRVRRNLTLLGLSLARSVFDLESVSFEFFATFMLRYYPPNEAFYFERSGAMGLDHVLRYERLQEDYREVCTRIGIPAGDLPSLKSKIRPRRHYSTYYNARTRAQVAEAYRRHVDVFGYRFEEE